jgi:S-adenosylmethionine:tRNA ribosyltransferase-isomerase
VSRAASRPPEARGLARDAVRMLVATPDGLAHARFADLPRYLAPGDLLVVNNSATVAAAVPARRPDGRPVLVHWSGRRPDGSWLVELRAAGPQRGRVRDTAAGQTLALPGGGSLTLLFPYPGRPGAAPAPPRIWVTQVTGDPAAEQARHGEPVRYSYVPDPWPLSAYQTVFARVPGSAEMPSAARPFTAGLVTELVAAGVLLATVTLHAGVASLEAGEPPLPEWYTVPAATAGLVNLTRAAGRRVVAVGTTSTRALESAVGQRGRVRPRHGLTGLVLGPDRPARVVSGLITGWHDPGASHRALLDAVAGPALVAAAYAEAGRQGYLWHEFGDSCLLLPPGGRPASSRAASSPPVSSRPGRRAASA